MKCTECKTVLSRKLVPPGSHGGYSWRAHWKYYCANGCSPSSWQLWGIKGTLSGNNRGAMLRHKLSDNRMTIKWVEG